MSVFGVWRDLFDSGDEVLVEEELADVRRVRSIEVCEGIVRLNFGVVDRMSENCISYTGQLEALERMMKQQLIEY